eukprot:TRINITY_DN4792_c0_g1_i2.p1 TRINITY_DN4792_c0_g1~~TRINITY_DN4792_c0_g1_i2.p1  ORF type:complete len:316 (-),score=32.95 TRINITY_DN4792_c0_g1_i2:85-999(-)
MLAKRLIHATSVSDDAEKVMISGLKGACGFEYTSKLQRMFNDIQLSQEINEKFRLAGAESEQGKLDVDFTILVLTAGSWPLQTQASNFNVPGELEKCMKIFSKFYNTLHNGRKLNWLHHLSKGDVKLLYLKRKYEFQATNYQIGVLLLFNNQRTFTREDILTNTGLNPAELNRTLQSLVDCKLIIVKKSEGNDLTDEFSLNMSFTSKRVRFKITTVLQAETPQQSAETRKVIEEDRKLYLQATIVRIMKARKSLKHNLLVKEVIEQAKARFHPNVVMIKKCIEQLIEKEYIQRMDQSDLYHYVA